MQDEKDELPVVAYLVHGGKVFRDQAVVFKSAALDRVEDRRDGSIATPLTDHTLATSKLAELQREVEGLRKEKARLDWLEGDGCSSVFKLGTRWYTRAGYGMPHHRATGLRAAIDRTLSGGEG